MAEASKDATQRLSAALDRIARATSRAAAAQATPAPVSPADAAPHAGPRPAELEALRARLDGLIAKLRDGLAEQA